MDIGETKSQTSSTTPDDSNSESQTSTDPRSDVESKPQTPTKPRGDVWLESQTSAEPRGDVWLESQTSAGPRRDVGSESQSQTQLASPSTSKGYSCRKRSVDHTLTISSEGPSKKGRLLWSIVAFSFIHCLALPTQFMHHSFKHNSSEIDFNDSLDVVSKYHLLVSSV